jgi:hypothetical protein
MNRIAIKINDHKLIIIKIRIRFEHTLLIRHEDIFNPLNSKMISNCYTSIIKGSNIPLS